MANGPVPQGTATVVLGDIAGSTRMWQQQRGAMSAASRRLAELLDDLAETHRGHRPREQGEGDNLVATFPAASDAAAFALALDLALAREQWPGGLRLAMRLALHTGDVEWHDQTGYLGPTFNRCARIRDLGHARMILVSQAARDIIADSMPDGAWVEDLGSHQLRDLSRAEHVYQLRQPGDGSAFPPLKSVTSLPNNLPLPVTSLVGREEEVPEISRKLLDHRLVTLTGAGGSGKTRLAQHVASQVLHLAPDGAWWVDLTPVDDEERIGPVIGEAVGVAEVPEGRHAAAVLSAGIGLKEMLVVLDNCEHLVDGAAEIAEVLLAQCPNVRFVATSREALDIDGEHAMRVRPLPQTDNPDPTLEDLRAGPATQLFLDRASTLEVGTLDLAARRAVANICRRLDGMPLAIELAAARTRLLSVGEIEAGLDQRFDLLTAGRRSRRGAGRQRTLEASIAWSFDLLEDEEQAMLCRLAVFPGPFDLDAARYLGTLGTNDPGALDLLTALVDKSLVTVRPDDDGRRYRLLESIRHYALDRLNERDEGGLARDAHLAFMVERISVLDPKGGTTAGYASGGLALTPAFLDDLRAASGWALASDRVRDVVDLFWPLFPNLILRGIYREAIAPLEGVRDRPELDLGRRVRAYSLLISALSSANQHREAVALADPAVALARELDDAEITVTLLTGIAYAQAWSGLSGSASARECLALLACEHEPVGPGFRAMGLPFLAAAFAYDGFEREGVELAIEGAELARREGLDLIEPYAWAIAAAHAVRLGLPAAEMRRIFAEARSSIGSQMTRNHVLLDSIGGIWMHVFLPDDDPQDVVAHAEPYVGPPGSGTSALLLLARAGAAYMERDLDGMVRHGQASRDAFARGSNLFFTLFGAWLAALGRVLRGDAGAERALESAWRDLPEQGFLFQRTWLHVTSAIHQLADDPDGSLHHCLRALRIMEATGSRGQRDLVEWVLAATLVRLGRCADAARFLGFAAAYDRQFGWGTRWQDKFEESASAARTELGGAGFAEAYAAGEAMSFEEVCDWLFAGTGLREGYHPLCEEAASAVTNWGPLTEAETAVAVKVAGGLSNREVAEVLFVSANTVKTHLKSIYAKFGITSREELARMEPPSSSTFA